MNDMTRRIEQADPSRIRAIKAELEKCANEYQGAKEQLDKAEIEYEAVREKFRYVRKRASELMSDAEWYGWRLAHTHVLYAGTPMGEAIEELLWSYAWDTAVTAIQSTGDIVFEPAKSLQEIYKDLDNGGFEFRSASPLREINAALMQLKTIVKLPTDKYQRADADEIFKNVRSWTTT